jgi:uncharacterized protein YjiS (DUF1127 family)
MNDLGFCAPAASELTMSQKDNSVPQFSSFEIERQARIKRSVVIQALARGTMRAFAKWLRSLVLRSTKLTRRLAARRRTYSDIRELQRFDDRMLADIGIATDRRAWFDGQLPTVNAQVLSHLLGGANGGGKRDRCVSNLCGSRPQVRHTDRGARRGRNLGASLLHCDGGSQGLQSGADRIGHQAL